MRRIALLTALLGLLFGAVQADPNSMCNSFYNCSCFQYNEQNLCINWTCTNENSGAGSCPVLAWNSWYEGNNNCICQGMNSDTNQMTSWNCDDCAVAIKKKHHMLVKPDRVELGRPWGLVKRLYR